MINNFSFYSHIINIIVLRAIRNYEINNEHSNTFKQQRRNSAINYTIFLLNTFRMSNFCLLISVH